MKKIFSFFAVILCVFTLQAVPAYRGLITVDQPDGTTIQIYNVGFSIYTQILEALSQCKIPVYNRISFDKNKNYYFSSDSPRGRRSFCTVYWKHVRLLRLIYKTFFRTAWYFISDYMDDFISAYGSFFLYCCAV